MVTMNDILSKIPYGYNIVVKNTISDRLLDDFIWTEHYQGCKLDVKYTHSTNIDSMSINTNPEGTIVIEFKIFDYATLSDVYNYAVKKKNMENIDEFILVVLEKTGEVFNYKISNTFNKFFDREIDHDRKYNGINYHSYISNYIEYTTSLGVHRLVVYM